MTTLFVTQRAAPHPAKYSYDILSAAADMLSTYAPPAGRRLRVLDPFAGTGKVYMLQRWLDAEISAIELEPEWAAHDARITVGNALELPYRASYFDAIVTSPTYGNRMADTLLDKYERVTYTSKIGRRLSAGNSGALQWGKQYRDFHVKAWTEAARVLRKGGLFVLNCKNHIRAGKEQHVVEWHIDTLKELGFRFVEQRRVARAGMQYGQNADKRVGFEIVAKLVKERA